MSKPRDAAVVLRLNYMVRYLSSFLPKIADLMKPLQHLMQIAVEYQWDMAQEEAFDRIKYLLYRAPELTYFDPQKNIYI